MTEAQAKEVSELYKIKSNLLMDLSELSKKGNMFSISFVNEANYTRHQYTLSVSYAIEEDIKKLAKQWIDKKIKEIDDRLKKI